MVSMSGITIPVMLDTASSPAQVLKQWARLYHLGHIAAPSLAVVTAALYAYGAMGRHCQRLPWQQLAAAGAATLAIVPFTFLTMLPTNNKLAALNAQDGKGEDLEGVKKLVAKWSRLHYMRCLFPIAGAIIGFAAVW